MPQTMKKGLRKSIRHYSRYVLPPSFTPRPLRTSRISFSLLFYTQLSVFLSLFSISLHLLYASRPSPSGNQPFQISNLIQKEPSVAFISSYEVDRMMTSHLVIQGRFHDRDNRHFATTAKMLRRRIIT